MITVRAEKAGCVIFYHADHKIGALILVEVLKRAGFEACLLTDLLPDLAAAFDLIAKIRG